MIVQVDMLTLISGPAAGAGKLYLSLLGDWDSVPESKSEVRERPQAEGAYTVARDYRRSLAFSIKGAYLGDSHRDAQDAKRQIKAVFGRGRPVTVTVTDVDGPMRRVASVRSLVFEPDYEGSECVFTADLVAFDPLMYGVAQTLSTGIPESGGGLVFPLGSTAKFWDFGHDLDTGRIAFTNVGSAPTWGQIDVRGGMTEGFVCTNVTTGKQVRFSREIPPNSVVGVNLRTGRAWIDSAENDVSGFLTVREFFSVEAETQNVIAFAALGQVSGVPQFSFTASPAYR